MSNVGRPRTGLKPCTFCQSTERDSNGQCRCRNVFYRVRQATTKTTGDKARVFYDAALKANKGNVEKALATTREEFPSLAARAKAPAKDRKAKDTRTTAQKRADAKEAKKNADVLNKALKAENEALKKAETKAEAALEKAAKPEPERYVLVVDDFEETKYARKDAAIKNGVRSKQAWTVTYKGKVVAQSDDLI